MFCIVAHHSFHCGIFGDATGWWALFFESLIVWHVDTFIGISGWFGMSFKWRKVIRIVGLMAWTSALSIGYLLVFDRSHLTLKSIGIHGGWFGETYLMFLFVIPFVNAAIQGLEKEPSKKVLFIWGIMAGAYALIWLPGHLLLPFSPSGVSGQSLFLFFFIYVTMRLVKMHADRIVFLKHHILIGGGGCFC